MELLPGKACVRGTDCFSHSHNSSHNHMYSHWHSHSQSHSHRRWIAPHTSPLGPFSASSVLTTHAQTPHSASTGPSVHCLAPTHNTLPSHLSSITGSSYGSLCRQYQPRIQQPPRCASNEVAASRQHPSVRFLAASHTTLPRHLCSSIGSSITSRSTLCRHYRPSIQREAPMACRAEAAAAVSAAGTSEGGQGEGVSSAGTPVGGQDDGDSIAMAPLQSLHSGQWVKLICGASFEDVVDVRNLSLVYTLAGVDCIDCAADAATVAATVEGIKAALELGSREGRVFPGVTRPWVMVSVSDDEDPHFRKAAFDPALCPADCPRPCERVCPTQAITFPTSPPLGSRLPSPSPPQNTGGVLTERCYGCGRCLPACPLRLIRTEPHVRRVEDLRTLLQTPAVDAIEIHTMPGHLPRFKELWQGIGEQAGMLKLVAVSTPDQGPEMSTVLSQMYATMRPQLSPGCAVLWQLDGRPMSGDLGPATARAAVRLALKVLNTPGMPPGFIQLAGGTNERTYDVMRAAGIWGSFTEQRGNEEGKEGVGNSSASGRGREGPFPAAGVAGVAGVGSSSASGKEREGLFPATGIAGVAGVGESSATGREGEGPFPATGVAGVAFGGSARALVSPILRRLDARVDQSLIAGDSQFTSARLEEHPDLLQEALALAQTLLRPMKSEDIAFEV